MGRCVDEWTLRTSLEDVRDWINEDLAEITELVRKLKHEPLRW